MIALALAFTGQIKPMLQEEDFEWDVPSVPAAKADSKSEPAESVVASAQSPAKKLLPSRTKSVPETSQSLMRTEQKIEPLQPTIEQVLPIEPKVEVPQVREELMEQRIVETATPVAEPTVEANWLSRLR